MDSEEGKMKVCLFSLKFFMERGGLIIVVYFFLLKSLLFES
jgi:hypothetical protein